MSFLKESDLRGYAQSTQKIQEAKTYIVKATYEASKTIFLSHSHKDKDLAQGLVNYLAGLGIKLYVDWQDSGMPRITDRKTAENIKKKISDLSYFLVLATPNALSSRWVPWEIGVADQAKASEKIAVIPVVDQFGKFEGNEYLQLYNRVEADNFGKLLVFEKSQTYSSNDIRAWFK